MNTNLDAAFAFMLGEEGGYSSDPYDTGNYLGATFVGSNLGVTASELAAWMAPAKVTALTMKALTRAQAEPIYKARYWQAMRCDDLPSGPDVMCVDSGYNAGCSTAAMELQTLVGVAADGWIGPATLAACLDADPARLARMLTGDAARALQSAMGVTADGQVGPHTLAALAVHPAARALALCCALHQSQCDRYRSLDQFPRYGAGWLARTGRRLALALSLVGKGT